MVYRSYVFLLLFICVPQTANHQRYTKGPHITEWNGTRYLCVNDKPYVVMSVQDHKTINLDGTVNEYYFKTAKDLCANTISVTFRWYAFEKEQNQYDTSILWNIKKTAEKYALKVIILWFGSNICGHENCVPNYIRKDPTIYIPHTRQDNSPVTKYADMGDEGIYCYSFNGNNKNRLLSREQKVLQELITWITDNDPEETFIMLQLQNEVFVNPDMWQPWPPVSLHPVSILPDESRYLWSDEFQVHGCSLLIETDTKRHKGIKLEFTLIDPQRKRVWNNSISEGERQTLRVGGAFINQMCQLMVRKLGTTTDTVDIRNVVLRPIAERCFCHRCNVIFRKGRFSSDQEFQQSVFTNYLKELAVAIARKNPNFPIYLNLYVAGDAKTLLGNPYYDPRRYMDYISDIDIIAPDIYLESSVSVIDSFVFGHNIIFIPEIGELKDQPGFPSPDAYSLIFPVLGKYNGIGVQVYDILSSDFGLVNADNHWENTAHLLRNSFSTVNQLLPTLFAESNVASMIGFRQARHQEYKLDGLEIVIKATGLPQYVRGVVVETDTGLVIAGIGFEAEIRIENASRHLERIERGYWKNDSFVSTGNLKQNTYRILEDKLVIRFDDDDFVASETFSIHEKQYVVRVKLK